MAHSPWLTWAERHPTASSTALVVFAIACAVLMALTEDLWNNDTVAIAPPEPGRWQWPRLQRRRRGGSKAAPSTQTIRLAIATMTRQPRYLEPWLAFHRVALGVEHFFLRVEDTPSLSSLLESHPWRAVVTVQFASGHARGDIIQQQERQMAHVRRSIDEARALGMTHLLHIDDDELMLCPMGKAALHAELRRVPGDTAAIHLQNVEMLAPTDVDNDPADGAGTTTGSEAEEHSRIPFAVGRSFVHSPRRFMSYTNGKSIGQLATPRLEPADVHTFVNAYSRTAPPYSIPAHLGVILHYESFDLAAWRAKHAEMAAHLSATGGVPTRALYGRFKQRSIASVQAWINADEGRRAEQGQHGHTEGRDEVAQAVKEAEAVWASARREPHGLPRLSAKEPPLILRQGVHRGITILPAAPFHPRMVQQARFSISPASADAV